MLKGLNSTTYFKQYNIITAMSPYTDKISPVTNRIAVMQVAKLVTLPIIATLMMQCQ